MNEHYIAVLADLRSRRMKLESELRELDAMIGGIQRLAGGGAIEPTAGLTVQKPTMVYGGPIVPHDRFANISVRWGVLWHLAEEAHGYEKTGEIATALRDGGYRTDAANFGNMVSAVLSTMKSKGEVETNDDGGYSLTNDGRQTWAAIKQGAKFRAAISPNEPTLLSVQ